ncbi:hypothetical protein PV328_005884 [Microctonus aethiopoides]|uniref:Mitotic spindle assembly checkpoint protein MAD1 n=1 Tax=Microctonus aethiopoides TaxID=144406 RepID=A0AA39KSS4_9HYME|nr:hypothetical protein PV328_005884 [Microctonus aethiopoides]
MGDKDPTTIIKMLNDLTSTSDGYRRNSNASLRLSGTGITPPLSMGWKNDDGLTGSTINKKCNEFSRIHTTDEHINSGISHGESETPSKRIKLSETRQSLSLSCNETDNVPGSPFEWRRLKGEIISLRTRLSHQETTIQQLHNIRKQIEEIFQKEKNMLEMQAALDKQTIKQLELRVESARNVAQEARDSQSSVENEMFQMKAKLEQKIVALLEENVKLTEHTKYANVNDNVPCPNINNQNEISEVQENLEKAQERINVLENQLKDAHELQQEFELQKVELQNAKIKIEKLECERALWEEGKSLLSRAARANELEKELHAARETIGMMRESIKGKLLIEEQMSNIMQRLKHTEMIERQVADLEVKNNELLIKLGEYDAIGIGDGPSELKKEIHRLQQAEALLTAEEGEMCSRIDALQRENQTLQRNYEETKTIANEMTASTEKLNKLVARLQKKVLLVSRERDSYRQQLDLYEKEMTSADSNSISNDRIPALERTLESYRDLVSKLEANLATSDAIRSREEYQKLRDENEKLKAELEHRILKGDFNCNARVLHFKMNPAAIASQQNEDKMKALYAEVEELRSQVKLGNSETFTGTSSVHAQEIAELKQSHEIKITRLKDAFKASSQEYRQACYQLFGWRVDRTKEGRYKLSSQYADSPDDYLYFHVGDGVDLLETPFSATLGPLIEQHLQIQHSVPMFLNAVQSELFILQTATNVL